MLKISFVFICAFAALGQDGGPVRFNLQAPDSGSKGSVVMPPFGSPGLLKGNQQGYFQIDSFSGPAVEFNAVVEPPLTHPDQLKLGWGVFKSQTKGSSVWHRFVIDQVHAQYFGYDLDVQSLPGPRQYRVTFAPLSIGPEQLQPRELSPLPLPQYPEPQTVTVGDSIAVDLLISPDGKRKIVDYIRFHLISGFGGPPPAKTTAAPRDYTLDDGPLKFDFAGFVLINDQRFQGQTWFTKGKDGGATLWFSFGGKGRYILSLAPHEGFLEAGTVRDNVVSFQAEGQKYEIRMNTPIAGSGGAWNLYVLHDPSYYPGAGDLRMLPPGASAGPGTVIGGTDRLQNLLPK